MTTHAPRTDRPKEHRAFLRPQAAADYIDVSRRKFYQLAETDPSFPRKIVLSARCVGWRREALDAWLLEREAAA